MLRPSSPRRKRITGIAAECAATIAIFPGDQAFRIVSLRDGNGMTLDSRRWARLIDLLTRILGRILRINADVIRSGPIWALHLA
jgi:hypothetical protein